MELSNMTKAVVAAVVGVFLIVVLAVPIIADNPVQERSYADVDGIVTTYSMLGSGESLVLTVGEDGITVGDDVLPLNSRYALALFSHSWKVGTDGSNVVNLSEYVNGAYTITAMAVGDTIAMSGGEATVTLSGASHTLSYTKLGYFDEEGIYGTTATNNAAANMPINANSGAMLVTPNTNCTTLAEIVSPSSGEVSAKVYTSSNFGNFYPATWTVTEADGVYTLSGAAVQFGGGSIPAYIIAPIQTYTMVDSDGAAASIVEVLPVFMAIGVVMMIVGAVVLRRDR